MSMEYNIMVSGCDGELARGLLEKAVSNELETLRRLQVHVQNIPSMERRDNLQTLDQDIESYRVLYDVLRSDEGYKG